jgi:Kef-type K+ transport system membrane component KefB
MVELLSFFIVLIAGVIITGFFNRINIPWVVALIFGGIIIGPHGLGVFEANETIEFIGQIGVVFLMFMAGLETPLSELKKSSKKVGILALFNASIPFVVGLLIGFAFGFTLVASILIGVIFISSSIAVIIPTLESSRLLESSIGKTIVAATVLEDAVSLVLLAIILQSVNPITFLPLPLFYILLVLVMVFMRWTIVRIEKYMIKERGKTDMFRSEVRTIFVILLGTVIIFEIIGLHNIIAGFFAGLVLSDTVRSKLIKERLRTISYGVFIPVFFVIIGTKTDLSVFSDVGAIVLLVLAIVIGLIVSKIVSGYIGARFAGFSKDSAKLAGVATIPQLSTTLAVAYSGVSFGILPERLITAMVVLSLVTVVIAPILVKMVAKKLIYNK